MPSTCWVSDAYSLLSSSFCVSAKTSLKVSGHAIGHICDRNKNTSHYVQVEEIMPVLAHNSN